MRARTSMKLLCEGPVNLYLLCTVVSRHARRLGRLMPEERIAELITIALRDCADHQFQIQLDGNVPEPIRQEAARMFPPCRIPDALLGSSDDQSDWRQTGNAVSLVHEQRANEGNQTDGEPNLQETATGIHVPVGNGVYPRDSYRNLHSRQGEHTMSNLKGMDSTHLQQLRAFAENLCTLAVRHGENKNYEVAYALYGRALEAAQRIDKPGHNENGNSFVARIEKDRQAVYELLCRAHRSPERTLLEKAQKVGR